MFVATVTITEIGGKKGGEKFLLQEALVSDESYELFGREEKK